MRLYDPVLAYFIVTMPCFSCLFPFFSLAFHVCELDVCLELVELDTVFAVVA